MIVDSHCHLAYKGNFENIDNIIQKAKDVNVKKFLNISTNFSEFKDIIEISKKYEEIYYTLGIHPHESEQTKSAIIDKIKQNVNDPKMLAIGETGLDFYYNHSKKTSQINSLQMHIDASQETGLPLIIHMRDAESEMIDIFNTKMKEKEFTGVIHCFTGSLNFAKKMIDLGFYISASGIITFKKSQVLRDTFKALPLNKILVETDTPFLAPEPNRGKTNEPSYIIHTVKKLAEIYEISYANMCGITSNNFSILFNN
ncbi:TatD family hydrolase [Pelagibacteraceae bacterium]|nr:TatD family hydrolase [Pelagibacteraceae bacterium]